MIDFGKSIFENRRIKGSPFLAAHRGVCGANIPCNTMTAYKIATDMGADVVEIDVSISKDGEYFVFHPGMESVFIDPGIKLSELTAEEIDKLYLRNSDRVKTSYKIPRLTEVLTFLKGKAYINVDKFWTDVEGISRVIREVGVENQVIVKTSTDKKSLDEVKKYAPDFMFVPIVREKDTVTDELIANGVNVIGAEILFASEDSEVISEEYIKKMHDQGLLIWVNSIIYNERDVLTAYHTDDSAFKISPDHGWGWLIDHGADFIQTDWLLPLINYINERTR